MSTDARVQTGFRYGRHKVEILDQIGEDVVHNGRTYRVLRVRVDSGQEYISVRLYNSQGKFIKQMMIEPEITALIGQMIKVAGDPIEVMLGRFPSLPEGIIKSP